MRHPQVFLFHYKQKMSLPFALKKIMMRLKKIIDSPLRSEDNLKLEKVKGGVMMFQIGLFSKIAKTTVKTLRYYEKIGLLKPCYIDMETGYRYYSTRELIAIHRIKSYKQMGMSLRDIQKILRGEDPELIVRKKKEELKREMKILEDQITRMGAFLIQQKEEKEMNYEGLIMTIPEVIVYSKKVRVPDYDAMFSVIPAIGQEVLALNPGLSCREPEYCFNIYLDGEYKEKDIYFELNEAVENFGVEGDGITFKKMPETTVASVMHKGAYDTLGEAYAYIYQWIEDNGYEASDHPRESFIDGIWNKASKEDWLTEVQVPVKKK